MSLSPISYNREKILQPAAIILTMLSSLALFSSSMGYYFFQDDWFVLNWVKNSSFIDLLKFRTDIIYWRPISMPIFFKINQTVFGLNPVWFHVVAFVTFFFLTAAVFSLFKVLTKDVKASFVIAFLYSTWSIHFISLSWLSTTSYIIGPLFEALSFILFLKFIQDRKKKNYALSLITFGLAIGSSEFAIVLPALLFLWGLILKRQNYLKEILPFLAVDFIYLVLRFYVFPIPVGGNYQLSPQGIISNVIWYFGWALGLPESFKDLVFIKMPHQSIMVLIQFWRVTVPAAMLFILIASQMILSFRKNLNDYLFGLVWFLVAISPVVALKGHSYPMYLSFAGLGLLFALSAAVKKAKIIVIIFLALLWLLTTKENLRFNSYVHWVVNEQSMSKAYTDFAKKTAPYPKGGTVFVFKEAQVEFAKAHHFVLIHNESTLRQALNDQAAMQVLYNDSSLKSLYPKDEDKINMPSGDIVEIRPRVHE